MMGAPRFVFYPRTGKGEGLGHLIRAIAFIREMRSRDGEAFLYVPCHFHESSVQSDSADPLNQDVVLQLLKSRGLEPDILLDEHSLQQIKEQVILIADLRAASPQEFTFLSSFPFLVGFDEGGAFRDRFPYLIDLLPGDGLLSRANTTASPVLPRGWRKSSRGGDVAPGNASWAPPDGFAGMALKDRPILLAFGGEDPQDLSEFVSSLLCRSGLTEPEDISVLRGPAQRRGGLIPGVTELEPVDDPLPLMERAKLLVCSYGLSAWEGVRAAVPVLLCNPSKYHERLGRKSGFPSLGVFPASTRGKQEEKRALAVLQKFFPRGISPPFSALPEVTLADRFETDDPAALLLQMKIPERRGCPLCGSREILFGSARPVRSRDRTFRRCPSCGCMVQILPFSVKPSYGKEYFLSEYKGQYGRSYLEDFPRIKAASRPRLEKMERLLSSPSRKRLLDIGCAYGPFLAAARERGWDIMGIELSPDAAKQGKELTGGTIFTGSALEVLRAEGHCFADSSLDAVTLWYVIEHLQGVEELIGEIWRVLRPGGVLALATPGFQGISGRRRGDAFFSESPRDHLCIMEPRQARAYLQQRGFRFRGFRFPSLHPERYPRPWGYLPRGALSLLQHAFRLGDTFEMYLIKGDKNR